MILRMIYKVLILKINKNLIKNPLLSETINCFRIHKKKCLNYSYFKIIQYKIKKIMIRHIKIYNIPHFLIKKVYKSK